MADNIIIKITGEADLTAAQKQLQDLAKQSEDYEKQLLQLKEAEKADEKTIKALGLSEEQLAKRLKENKEYYRQEVKYKKDDIAATKNSIKQLNDQVKSYKTLNGTMGKAAQQLRAMREELMRMEDAGEYGTQAFIDLSIKAAELEDQMGDLQQRIRILSSDTKNMDAIMGLGDGLAGSFYIATSATELFGGELEGLQQAFYKVQAAMAIVSGVQQVFNALQKDSAAMVVLNTALTKIFGKSKKDAAVATTLSAAASTADAGAKVGEAVATEAAAAAQGKLNAMFLANPIGVIIAAVAALAAGIFVLVTAFGKSARAAREAKKAQQEYEKQASWTAGRLQSYSIVHEQAIHNIDKTEQEHLQAAKKRHASELEMSEIELDALKKRADETVKYVNKAIKANNEETRKAKEFADAKRKQRDTETKGSKNWYKLQEELNDAEEKYYDIVRRGLDLEKQRGDAKAAVTEKELEIEEQRRQLSVQAEDARIQLLRDGEQKEIKQIKANFKEKLREIKGQSKEEKALRAALIKQRDQEIADIERKYVLENAKALTEIDVKEWEERTKKLNGSEGVKKQLEVWSGYYEARKYQLEENARIEKEEVNRSTDSEETKKNKIAKIEADLQAALNDIAKEGAQKRIEIEGQRISALKLAAEKAADAVEKAQGGNKLQALKTNLDAQIALYDAQQRELEELWHNGDEKALISKQEYENRMWEITKAATDARTQYELDSMQTIADGFQTALETMQQTSDMVFEAIGNQIQDQIDKLDKMYTTDWQEAQKDANKKYLTQRDYEKKKAALEEKQAKYQKAQAIITASINTALSVVNALASVPYPANLVMAAIAAAMGAAQIAVIASKPLAQYEKGRKGGKGEYAIVGEKGAELMYVPQGASIVPHNKLADQDAWGAYGVPRLPMPETPSISADAARFITTTTDGRLTIDYDKLGEAVARNIPTQKAVTVNVDRTGVHVQDGSNLHTYLNTKYNGAWG